MAPMELWGDQHEGGGGSPGLEPLPPFKLTALNIVGRCLLTPLFRLLFPQLRTFWARLGMSQVDPTRILDPNVDEPLQEFASKKKASMPNAFALWVWWSPAIFDAREGRSSQSVQRSARD